jgi:hypothetical protein
MTYPTSCGTNGSITDISLACLNDLWKAPPGNCNTTLTASAVPKAFTLVGSTPGLLSFSTYGQPLSVVSSHFAYAAQTYPILCQSGTYTDKSTAGSSNIDIVNTNNTELNGLTAQYSFLYKQYTDLMKNPPANVVTTTQAVYNAKTAYDANKNAANETALNNATTAAATASQPYESTKANIKTDIDLIYPKIKTLADTINSSLKLLAPTEQANSAAIQSNATNLINKINEMNTEFINLTAELNKPAELDGNYEFEQVKTTSNFMKKFLYFLLVIILVGCLVMLKIAPTEGKLDMFILGLGVIILVYYIYDYFQKRRS